MLNLFIDIPSSILRPLMVPDREAILEEHFDAAIEWIRLAFIRGEGGISKGYDLVRGKWAPAYPETTGYTIPTLLNACASHARPELKKMALELADYLLSRATQEGGIVHWEKNGHAKPIVFDTGQVIFGWIAAYEASQDKVYLRAAQNAGDWLVSVQSASGAWMQNQHLGVVKVIDTRVAWALLELHRLVPDPRYQTAAIKNLEWAAGRQHEDGWFENCAFTPTGHPFTHTLVYTAEGLMECGIILGEEKYLSSAVKTADALLSFQGTDGSLPGVFGAKWKIIDRPACLTGNCQAARLWMQCFELYRNERYWDAGVNSIQFVASTQQIQAKNANIQGGISGSYPIYGPYERLKYPNWAAKFFLDAILTMERILQQSSTKLQYKG